MQCPRSARCVLFVYLSLLSWPAAAQNVTIAHDSIDCWPSDQYPVLAAEIAPPEDVRAVRVYFRAEQYPDFYFVDASLGPDGSAEAVLPLAASGTERVVYYIEAVTLSFGSSRSDEWNPQVSDSEDCRRRDPLLALFEGGAPRIVVRAIGSGAAAIPPGFLAAGVVSGGGGLGAAAVGGIVAGGAAGGVVVATAGGESESGATTTVASAAPPTSIPAGTTTVVGMPTTTSTVPASGTTTTVSTGSTTTVPSSPTTTAPPTSTTTTPPTSTTASPLADVSVSISGPSTTVLGNVLTYDVTVQNQGPSSATGARLTVSFPSTLTLQSASGASCTGFVGSVECDLGTLSPGASRVIQVRVLALQLGSITANASVTANETDPLPGNNSASSTTNVTVLLREPASAPLSVTTHLDVPPHDGRERGEAVIGGRAFTFDSAAPIELHVRPRDGELVVDAVLIAASGREGRWRFDFRGAGPSSTSITVQAGDVLALEPGAVAFRVRGEPGERIRFTYVAK